ncbi:MAG: hypothetical protein ACFFD5_04060 [Candidatus Thorarchaeota archaeon]
MRIINRKIFIILKILYLLTLLIFLTIVVSKPQYYPYDGNLLIIGLIQGGMIEAILFLTSIVLIHNLKWRFSFILGMVGCVIFGLDILFYRFVSSLNYKPGLQDSNLITFLYLICWAIILTINILYISAKPSKNIYGNYDLKKEILDLSTKFTRLEVRGISEKLDKDPILVLNLIKNMLKNKEVYGEYFESTKTITFDQQANIDEIDQLLSKFSKFEEKKIEKKI